MKEEPKLKIVVGTPHLQRVVETIPRLVEAANKGDQEAIKALSFADRYGHSLGKKNAERAR